MTPKKDWRKELTVSEPVSATLEDGRKVHGTVWREPGAGHFLVSYDGMEQTDGRAYSDRIQMMAVARMILRDLAGDS